MLPNLRLARPHLHDLLSSLPHYGAHYEGFTRRRSALVAAPRRYHSGRVVVDAKLASLQTSMANLQLLILNLTSDLEVRKAVGHFLSSN